MIEQYPHDGHPPPLEPGEPHEALVAHAFPYRGPLTMHRESNESTYPEGYFGLKDPETPGEILQQASLITDKMILGMCSRLMHYYANEHNGSGVDDDDLNMLVATGLVENDRLDIEEGPYPAAVTGFSVLRYMLNIQEGFVPWDEVLNYIFDWHVKGRVEWSAHSASFPNIRQPTGETFASPEEVGAHMRKRTTETSFLVHGKWNGLPTKGYKDLIYMAIYHKLSTFPEDSMINAVPRPIIGIDTNKQVAMASNKTRKVRPFLDTAWRLALMRRAFPSAHFFISPDFDSYGEEASRVWRDAYQAINPSFIPVVVNDEGADRRIDNVRRAGIPVQEQIRNRRISQRHIQSGQMGTDIANLNTWYYLNVLDLWKSPDLWTPREARKFTKLWPEITRVFRTVDSIPKDVSANLLRIESDRLLEYRNKHG